ncbi:DUF4178 domain-containing protein [Rhodopirellula sp. MGV]|uniref:DUF4178 domain-containing protein n=1 Tax=Rhodopirellula sp. MGV TaxID=2023130 RepID=UPI000B964CD4|nr:DUF4178 domain-containing protein [Rhodopirellula sp. MGV]OYP38172.1 hypothetical protein CGZ80_02780 [Rhodopirellula sp. MGV]PNY38506.1 DUF4178 domain-containing protein [Rhodopirellula baltica]
MKGFKTKCPACGGPTVFRNSWALVTVCDFCGTTIGRTDRDVEDLGKFAEVSDPASGLRRGVKGRWKGQRFTIVGRVRYRHSGGGSWDEWYLEFPGNKVGWLSEAQGQFALTSQYPLREGTDLPTYDSLDLLQTVPIKRTNLTVREKGVATAEGAEGEIPWHFVPGAEHHYVDLQGDTNQVATFEYGEGGSSAGQAAFLGTTVTLSDLHIDINELKPEIVDSVDAVQLPCPKCAGPLSLHAPDDTLRIACPNCSSMLDVNDGKLSLFQSLHQEASKVQIPLGSEGVFGDTKYVVIGFMERYAKWEGKIFPWSEYLLYNRDAGYRWLICNSGHWSLAAPVTSTPKGKGTHLGYDKQTFRLYDRGTAHVRYLLGEFYWKVNIGDVVQTSDYICPPRMVSFEQAGYGKSKEVTISESFYITPEEVESIFGVKDLPRPWGVGVIQPKPSMGKSFWLMWAGFLVYLLLAAITVNRNKWDGGLLTLAAIGVSIIPGLTLFYLHSFEVQRWQDSDYSPYASDD